MQGDVDMVSYQLMFNLAVGVAGALGGWTLNTLWNAVKDLQRDDKQLTEKVNNIEVLVAGKYVTRDEMNILMREVYTRLDKILDRVGQK